MASSLAGRLAFWAPQGWPWAVNATSDRGECFCFAGGSRTAPCAACASSFRPPSAWLRRRGLVHSATCPRRRAPRDFPEFVPRRTVRDSGGWWELRSGAFFCGAMKECARRGEYEERLMWRSQPGSPSSPACAPIWVTPAASPTTPTTSAAPALTTRGPRGTTTQHHPSRERVLPSVTARRAAVRPDPAVQRGSAHQF